MLTQWCQFLSCGPLGLSLKLILSTLWRVTWGWALLHPIDNLAPVVDNISQCLFSDVSHISLCWILGQFLSLIQGLLFRQVCIHNFGFDSFRVTRTIVHYTLFSLHQCIPNIDNVDIVNIRYTLNPTWERGHSETWNWLGVFESSQFGVLTCLSHPLIWVLPIHAPFSLPQDFLQ
jgi:hypothetical protein